MKAKHNGGFTLIELLVVITIIAILASFAVPVFNSVVGSAQQTKQVNNCKQIALACNVFAADQNGIFPDGRFDATTGRIDRDGTEGGTAILCFQDLIDSGKLVPEKMYWSPQHAPGGICDALPPDEDGTLEDGENCWDYARGLTNGSNASLPLLFEASDDGGVTWTSVNNEGAHPWDNVVVVGFVDGSASKEQIGSAGTILRGDDSNLCEVGATASGYPASSVHAPAK